MGTRTIRLLMGFFILGLLALGATGCGSGLGVVKGVSFDTKTVNNDVYGEFKVDLSLGSSLLPNVTLPVHIGNVIVGEFQILDRIGGGSEVDVSVDLSQALKAKPNAGPLLPNGATIPVTLPNGVPVIAFQVGSTSTWFYLAFGSGTGMAGMAITIREFATIGSLLGGLNYFPSFTLGIFKGVVGVFTSPDPSENGLAMFVDVTPKASGVAAAADMLSARVSGKIKINPVFNGEYVDTGDVTRDDVNEVLYQESKESRRLTLVSE